MKGRWIVVFTLGVLVCWTTWSAAESKKPSGKSGSITPARINFSGNLVGEIDACSCKHKKGGLAWRAGFLSQARPDSMANVTIEAGNFVAKQYNAAEWLKATALIDFFKKTDYDAVGLSTNEIRFGLEKWESAAKSGVPVVCANLFTNPKARKPLFRQYVLKRDNGHVLGVIHFVSDSAWAARSDAETKLGYKSPFEMGELVSKVAGQCDHLTVSGDFSVTDADSLARSFPEIDLIVSAGISYGERPRTTGSTVIVGTPTKGYNGHFVDWSFVESDTTLKFRAGSTVLDAAVPTDSTIWAIVADVKQRISNAESP